MTRFRHYKEAGGKKTVLGKGNNHDNWTLRVTWERRLRGPVGCKSRAWLTGTIFERAWELGSSLPPDCRQLGGCLHCSCKDQVHRIHDNREIAIANQGAMFHLRNDIHFDAKVAGSQFHDA